MSRRKSQRRKELQGTARADRGLVAVRAAPLHRWPKAPDALTQEQRAAWDRLGRALLPLQTIGAADLELVRVAAVAVAAADAAARSPEAKVTAITAALRLAGDLLARLGLGPAARATVEPLGDPDAEDSVERDIFGRRP